MQMPELFKETGANPQNKGMLEWLLLLQWIRHSVNRQAGRTSF
jgi:hypothetical protein